MPSFHYRWWQLGSSAMSVGEAIGEPEVWSRDTGCEAKQSLTA